MRLLLTGIGLVLVVEGLAWTLAPSRMEEALRLIASLSPDQRRALGLGAMALGILILATLRHLAG
ncbi:DUF2065 domain-containing protein [Neotabrizicola shimadae]|uniref:DUF2065 domain-containing protein n=1 Tax=Neotabrizicola shimadae TaxID=2807096 RepID=A0A8G1EC45_9RHOB|nr:DUF2065 domain-containing protein [Neotabrizicola shimadae]QYZ70270.1 DUF2065 domain-containing protein [Neotabrizicola shimadae]